MRITTQTLLDLLPIVATNRMWRVDSAGNVRSDRNECPICAIVNEIDGGWWTTTALVALESLARRGRIDSSKSIYCIGGFMRAADNFFAPNEDEACRVRAAILAGLGLANASVSTNV